MFNNHRFTLAGGLEGITYVNRPKPQEQDHFILIEEGTVVPDDCLAILDESSNIENAKVLRLVTGVRALTGQLNGSPYNSILATTQYNNHKKEEQNYDSNSTGSGESNRGVSERSELDRIEDSPRGDGGQGDGSGESGTGEDNNSPVPGSSGVVEERDTAVSGAAAEGAGPVKNNTGSFFGRVLSDGGRGDRVNGSSIREAEELHQESNAEVRRSIFSSIPSASSSNTANAQGLGTPTPTHTPTSAMEEVAPTPAVSPANTANAQGLDTPKSASVPTVESVVPVTAPAMEPVVTKPAPAVESNVSPANTANAQGLDTPTHTPTSAREEEPIVSSANAANAQGLGTPAPTAVTEPVVSPANTANAQGLDAPVPAVVPAPTPIMEEVPVTPNKEEAKEDGHENGIDDGSGGIRTVRNDELLARSSNVSSKNDDAREGHNVRTEQPERAEVYRRPDVESGSPHIPDATSTECIRVVDEKPPESAVLPGEYTDEEKQLHNEFAEFLHMVNIPWTRQAIDESIVSELYCKENKWRYAKGFYIIDSLSQGRRYFYNTTTGQLKGVRL